MRGKTFVWLDESDGALSLTVKLPVSRDFALVFDFAAPAGYGLGRSGWISCRFGAGEVPDLDLMRTLARGELSGGGAEEARRFVTGRGRRGRLAAELRFSP